MTRMERDRPFTGPLLVLGAVLVGSTLASSQAADPEPESLDYPIDALAVQRDFAEDGRVALQVPGGWLEVEGVEVEFLDDSYVEITEDGREIRHEYPNMAIEGTVAGEPGSVADLFIGTAGIVGTIVRPSGDGADSVYGFDVMEDPPGHAWQRVTLTRP